MPNTPQCMVHLVVIQDVPSQDGKPWTRFVFNSEALLEEEGAAPDIPAEEAKGSAGLGAFDFRPHRSQQIGKPAEDAHEVNTTFSIIYRFRKYALLVLVVDCASSAVS